MALSIRRIGSVRVDFTWEEANEALAALEQRAVFFHAILRGPCSPELRTHVAAALLASSEAEGRLAAALTDRPDLDDGNHYAGMPDRHTGLGGEL
jgi:hypothetical protein